MALKRKINKIEYDGLNDVLKAEYKQSGDTFVLDTDDATELQASLDAERKDHKVTKEKLFVAAADLKTITDKSGDAETLITSYKHKVEKLESDVAAANTAASKLRHDFVAGGVAKELAIKNFKAAHLIEPLIAKRLAVDPKDGTTLIVLDKDGKPSAMSKEDLLKEFVDNKEYADIVIASRATGTAGPGGSAPTSQTPFTPPIDPRTNAPKTYDKYTSEELKAHMEAKRAAASNP